MRFIRRSILNRFDWLVKIDEILTTTISECQGGPFFNFFFWESRLHIKTETIFGNHKRESCDDKKLSVTFRLSTFFHFSDPFLENDSRQDEFDVKNRFLTAIWVSLDRPSLSNGCQESNFTQNPMQSFMNRLELRSLISVIVDVVVSSTCVTWRTAISET